MKGVQCYELFGAIALKIHTFSFSFFFTVHMCMVWPCHSFVDGLSLKCINVYLKKSN